MAVSISIIPRFAHEYVTHIDANVFPSCPKLIFYGVVACKPQCDIELVAAYGLY